MSARISSGTTSKQDYGTPYEFINAVEQRWRPLDIDLAAHAGNHKAARFYTATDNALADDISWPTGEVCWLNPPFNDIAPWAAKCAATRLSTMGRIFFLVPASIGSNWFAAHVHGKALVLALGPRMSFDGKHPFPKDMILAVYGETPGFDVWRWKGGRR